MSTEHSEEDLSIFAAKFGSSHEQPASGASQQQNTPTDVAYFSKLITEGAKIAKHLGNKHPSEEADRFSSTSYPHLPNINVSPPHYSARDSQLFSELGLDPKNYLPDSLETNLSSREAETTIPFEKIYLIVDKSPAGILLPNASLIQTSNQQPITGLIENILEEYRPPELPPRNTLLRASLAPPEIHPSIRVDGRQSLVITEIPSNLILASDSSLIREIRNALTHEGVGGGLSYAIQHAVLYWASMVPLSRQLREPSIANPRILVPQEHLINPLTEIPAYSR